MPRGYYGGGQRCAYDCRGYKEGHATVVAHAAGHLRHDLIVDAEVEDHAVLTASIVGSGSQGSLRHRCRWPFCHS